MTTANKTFTFNKDVANKKATVIREFAAPVDKVWRAWTEPALLDQWWAPRPWKAVTSSMDFRVGGSWLYAMQGPDGSKQFCRFDYKTIDTQKSYSGIDAFCDAQGNTTDDFPGMSWKNAFKAQGDSTRVEIEINFPTEEAMNKIIEMGFQEGFTSAMENLDELLAQ